VGRPSLSTAAAKVFDALARVFVVDGVRAFGDKMLGCAGVGFQLLRLLGLLVVAFCSWLIVL